MPTEFDTFWDTGDPGMGGGGGTTQPQSTPWYEDPGFYLNTLNTLIGGYGAYQNYSATRQSNKTNVLLARENQAFTREMSNTAVQRRADDIEKAGGNRALAFTGGQEASAPVMSPARVEPAKLDLTSVTAMMLAKAQVDNLKAQTEINRQEARKRKIDADNAETYGGGEAGMGALRYNKLWNEVGMQALDRERKKIENDMSAAQLGKFKEMWPVLVQTAKQQAQEGKLNLEALENIAKVGGIEGTRLAALMGVIVRLIK